MVSAYLAQMALSLDYEITICDPRQDLLDQFSVPAFARWLICRMMPCANTPTILPRPSWL